MSNTNITVCALPLSLAGSFANTYKLCDIFEIFAEKSIEASAVTKWNAATLILNYSSPKLGNIAVISNKYE